MNPSHFFHPDGTFHFRFSQHKDVSHRSIAAIDYILISCVYRKMKGPMTMFGVDTELPTWNVRKWWLSAMSFSYFSQDNSTHHTDRTFLLMPSLNINVLPSRLVIPPSDILHYFRRLYFLKTCHCFPFLWLYSFLDQNPWPYVLGRRARRFSTWEFSKLVLEHLLSDSHQMSTSKTPVPPFSKECMEYSKEIN